MSFCPPPHVARIPGPAGVVGGKRRGRTKSGKGGRGFISPAGIFSSPHADRVLGSAGGARRASSSLVPRLAPRGFPVRQGWRGGERQGWRVSAVRKGGGCAGCEKGHGRGRVTFPPLGSVLTSHRSDSRSGTKWWGAASLPHVDQVPGSAGMVGRERDAKRHEHRVWAAVCAGERTGWQGKKKRRCALASARMTGRGILPHVDQVPGSAGMVGRERDAKKGTAKGMGGGVRWRAHGVSGQEKTGVRWRARGEAGRGKGEVRADPAECNSPRTVRAGRFALDPGGYLSSRAVSSQVLSAYEGLTAVFGMGTGGTPQLNHRKLPVP